MSWLGEHGLGHQAAFEVPVVDTFGAGHAFRAAFTLALAEGRSEREAVHFATGAAAVTCTQPAGPDGLPSRAQVEALVASNPHEHVWRRH